MTHRPNQLALLISLIGLGMSAGAQASSVFRVPDASALDVVRWTPGRIWQQPDGQLQNDHPWPDLWEYAGTPLRDDPRAGVAPPAAEPLRNVAAAELDADRVDIALPHATPAYVPPRQAAPQANTPPATDPARDGVAYAELDADRVDIVLPLEAPAESLQAKTVRPFVEPVNITLDIDLTSLAWQPRRLDGDHPSGMNVVALEQAAARIAERFPAAVPAREYAAPRRPPRLLCHPQREIVVATPAERVLRGLGAVLACDGHNVAEAWSPEVEERVVTTQADKVLAMLQELTDARRASAVEDKRRAHREHKRAQRAALQAEAAARAPAAGDPIPDNDAPKITAVDIDLGMLTALPTLARTPSALGKAVAVADTSLGRLRGGFVGAGLNISFGVERQVFVNGELVRSTSLHVSELGRISGGSSTSALPVDTSTLAVIQTGAGNTVANATFSPTSLGTVVQNTLDGQNIRNLTVINATVNSLGVLRGLNLQSSMRSAVIDSLRR